MVSINLLERSPTSETHALCYISALLLKDRTQEQPDARDAQTGCGAGGGELAGTLQSWHHLPAPPRGHQPGSSGPDALQSRVFNGGFENRHD